MEIVTCLRIAYFAVVFLPLTSSSLPYEGLICGRAVAEAKDYAPEANMLEYTLSDGCGFIVRPSGTEPKIKIYYSVKAASEAAVKAEGAALKAEVTRLLGLD